jgi:hypothetical protein
MPYKRLITGTEYLSGYVLYEESSLFANASLSPSFILTPNLSLSSRHIFNYHPFYGTFNPDSSFKTDIPGKATIANSHSLSLRYGIFGITYSGSFMKNAVYLPSSRSNAFVIKDYTAHSASINAEKSLPNGFGLSFSTTLHNADAKDIIPDPKDSKAQNATMLLFNCLPFYNKEFFRKEPEKLSLYITCGAMLQSSLNKEKSVFGEPNQDALILPDISFSAEYLGFNLCLSASAPQGFDSSFSDIITYRFLINWKFIN